MAKKKTDDKVRVQMPDFAKQMQRLKSIYHNSWFLPDNCAVEEWYGIMQGFSLVQIRAAVDFWIKTNNVEPKPSDLIAAIQSSGISADGSISGSPLDWPIVVISQGPKVIYECRVSPNAEVNAAKKKAMDYVCGTLALNPMDVTVMYMPANVYNKEVLHKDDKR